MADNPIPAASVQARNRRLSRCQRKTRKSNDMGSIAGLGEVIPYPECRHAAAGGNPVRPGLGAPEPAISHLAVTGWK